MTAAYIMHASPAISSSMHVDATHSMPGIQHDHVPALQVLSTFVAESTSNPNHYRGYAPDCRSLMQDMHVIVLSAC